MKNYIKLEKLSLLYRHYVFVDTEEHLADQIFVKHKIKVDFGKEYAHPDSIYRMLFCRVRKRNAAAVESALWEMNNKMLLLGHTDYEQYCSDLMRQFGFQQS